MPLTSRTSPKGAVFVPISMASRNAAAFASAPHSPDDAEIRAIVAAALVDGISTTRRPPSENDSPVIEPSDKLASGGFHGGSGWMNKDVPCPTVSTKTLFSALVAGFVTALWALAVQPLHVHLQSLHEGRYLDAVVVGALLTALLLFCDSFIGSCSVTGCGFAAHQNSNPTLSLRQQLHRCLQTTLGNTAGAVFGATAVAVAVQRTADAGFTVSSEIMGAAIDAARVVADAQPPYVFLSAVAAAFLLTAAMSCSGVVDKLFFRTSSAAPSFMRLLHFALFFIASAAVVFFDCRVGMIDKSFVSATAAFNAMQPLTRPLGPNVFNYLFAILGNVLGAALGRATIEIVITFIAPAPATPVKDAPKLFFVV